MKRPLLLLASFCFPLCAFADNWPMWRGANGDGTCAESGLPERWGMEENVAWKVKLPDRGNSTP
ncbi:MAG: serine/threonine protein kinase, partial [Verrucomicrobiaceae bacterium]|nr:serine/threonine protein kinase [Verrucomicrobiaceae bacterium]